MGNWCPLIKKACRDDCVLFRSGVRYFDDKKQKPVAFQECGINIAIDCLENLIMRNIGQQKAIEQTRNGIDELQTFFRSAFTFARKKEEKLPQ